MLSKFGDNTAWTDTRNDNYWRRVARARGFFIEAVQNDYAEFGSDA